MKRKIYKIINDVKNRKNSAHVDDIFKKYQESKEQEPDRGNKGAHNTIKDKKNLIQILEVLEEDNLVMYSVEDGMVVLI